MPILAMRFSCVSPSESLPSKKILSVRYRFKVKRMDAFSIPAKMIQI